MELDISCFFVLLPPGAIFTKHLKALLLALRCFVNMASGGSNTNYPNLLI